MPYKSALLFLVYCAGIFYLCSCTHVSISKDVFCKADSTQIQIQGSNAAHIQNVCVAISNNSNNNLSFYLTPSTVDYLNDSTIVASLFPNAISDKQKALHLYQFLNGQQTFSKPVSTQSKLLHQPARFLQSFGAGQCDDASSVLCALAIKAGLKARLYHLNGHIVAELFYDNAWHMFDANNGIVIKNEQGKILSVKEIEDDPSIINRNQFANSASVTLAKYLLKQTISSINDNHIDNWLLSVHNDYTSIINLSAQDSIVFKTYARAENVWKRWLNIRLDNPYSANGTYFHKAQMGRDSISFISLPYSITSVDVIQKGKGIQKVYYSPNGTQWFFKGQLNAGLNTITFDTKQTAEVPFAFNYYIKFISEENSRPDITLVNHFTFSEKQFLSNYNEVLLIKPVGDSSMSRLKVNCRVN
jgi:hypothetical protein